MPLSLLRQKDQGNLAFKQQNNCFFCFFVLQIPPPRPKHLRITRDYSLLVFFSRALTAAALRAAIGQAVNSDQEQQREKHFLQKFNPVSYVSEFTV
jgi:hypothetical protein